RARLEYMIPARGLIGFQTEFRTVTAGRQPDIARTERFGFCINHTHKYGWVDPPNQSRDAESARRRIEAASFSSRAASGTLR
ncbi:MAG: hypothetical protein WAS23_06940, partial [Dokdonella sp.]|uniref:hypothetical protein n=1 Tax=Dokdonella sp. TaxID=2291710 RepID=UPI003BAE6ECA